MFILKGIKNFLSDLYHIALQSFVLLYTWALLNISFTLSVQLLFYLAFHVLPVVSRGLGSVFSQPIFQLLFRWTPASFFWFHTFFIFGFINIYSKKSRLIWRSSLVCSVSLSLAFIFYACSHIRSLNFQQTA